MKSQFNYLKLVLIAGAMVCFNVLSTINGGFMTGPSLVNAASTEIKGVLKVHPTNPRYFTNNSGKVVYLTGAHTYKTLQDGGPSNPPPEFDYSEYLDFLEQHNHNFFRMWYSEYLKDSFTSKKTGIKEIRFRKPIPYKRTGPGLALDGKPKLDLTKYNEEFFTRLRSRVIKAKNRGIYVAIILFQGWQLHSGGEDWRAKGHWSHPKNNINGINGDPNGDNSPIETQTLQIPAVTAIQKAFVKKVIQTVNDLDNVLYDISNESRPESKYWQYEMIKYIKNVEAGMAKQHPVGMTSCLRKKGDTHNINVDLFNSKADWISPNGDGGYQYNPPAADGSKVIILDSDHAGVGTVNRDWIWKSFLRGYNPIQMDWSYGQQALEEARIEGARKAMGDTLRYAKKMNLTAVTPKTQISSTTYALAKPGSEYLIYQSESGSFTVSLKEGKYNYEWFRPKTGKVISTGTVNAQGGNKSFTPPFSGTAVLYLKSTSNTGGCTLASKFQTANLNNGTTYYTDRTHTLNSVPSQYAGLNMIKTPNDDRNLIFTFS